MRRLLITILLATTVGDRAAAQSRRDPPAAEALYRAGVGLLERGDWRSACAKFEASRDADPTVDALLEIARCREREGKLVDAWYTLQQALTLNRTRADASAVSREELQARADKRLEAIEIRMPRIRIVLNDPPPAFRVTRDGAPQPTATLGEAIPADPGMHEIVVEAPGFVSERRSVSIAEHQTLDIAITLRPEATAPAPAMVRPIDAGLALPRPPAPSDAVAGGRRRAGFVVGGLGLASLTAAGVLGGVSLGESSPDRDHVTHAAAFALAGVGVAALGTGVALVLTAPTGAGRAPTSIAVGPRAVSLTCPW